MRKFLLILPLVVLLWSCTIDEPDMYETIGFEDMYISGSGYLDAELGGSFVSRKARFFSQWVPEYGGYSDGGIYPSRLNDQFTIGFQNQYSALPSTNGGTFAVVHYSAYIAEAGNNYACFVLEVPTTINSIQVANSAYTYWSMKTGEDGIGYCRPYTDGDWFKVTFTGFDVNGVETGSVDYYLADFRDGKSFISSNWETVSLVSLGNRVSKVEISMDGTDRNEFGLNTPTYCCIDNIEYEL